MKVILEFDCENDNGVYNEKDAKKAIHASDAFMCLWDIQELVRRQLRGKIENQTAEQCLDEILVKIQETNLQELIDG